MQLANTPGLLTAMKVDTAEVKVEAVQVMVSAKVDAVSATVAVKFEEHAVPVTVPLAQ